MGRQGDSRLVCFYKMSGRNVPVTRFTHRQGNLRLYEKSERQECPAAHSAPALFFKRVFPFFNAVSHQQQVFMLGYRTKEQVLYST